MRVSPFFDTFDGAKPDFKITAKSAAQYQPLPTGPGPDRGRGRQAEPLGFTPLESPV